MEYRCHLVFPENPPTVLVRQWSGKKSFKDFLFVGSKHSDAVKNAFNNIKKSSTIVKGVIGEELYAHIEESDNIDVIYNSLFKDDTIQKTLLKILTYLGLNKEKFFPYAWSDEGPLRFRFVQNLPTTYNVNPFFSKMTSPPRPDIQQLSERIVKFNILEFITYTDFNKHITSDLKPYYFPNDKDIVQERELSFANQDNIVLTDLWYDSPINTHKVLINDNQCNYTRAYFEDKILLVNYKQLFNNLNSDETIPFIQFCDDLNNIYYKVSHKHKISTELFNEWTDITQIQTKHSLTLYSFINGTTSYMKTVLSEGTDLHILYRISPLDIIEFSDINKHLVKLQKKLKVVGIDTAPRIDRLALKTTIKISNIDMKGLAKVLMKYPTIFKFDNSKNTITDKTLNFMFIRVEKFGEPTDLIDYIRDRLSVHVSLTDIIFELSEYGIDRDEVIEYFNQIQEEDTDILKKAPKAKKNFKNKGLIITIIKKSHELGISINNASSFIEIQNALFWIRCGVIKWSKTKKEPETKKKQEKLPSPKQAVSESEPESELPSTRSLSSLEGSMSGGAGEKLHSRYLINQLEAHDPMLFKDKDNAYSRSCGASEKRQPVVMSLEQKQKIDNAGYSDGYDNYIVYGSDPSKQNVYMCPRVYCPMSRIPISAEKYKQGIRCPLTADGKEETPMLLFNGAIWENNIDKPHYIGFMAKKGSHNMHLPCCFKTKQKNIDAKLKGEIETPAGEGGYIIDKMKQLPVGRFGSIPNTLHDIIHKDIPYKLCKSSVKGSECILRRGIEQSSDSLMESISYLLNFSSKKELCDAIKKNLDPFTFITLENGEVYTYFIPSKPIFPEKNIEKRVILKKWLLDNKAYTNLFDLTEIIEHLDKPTLPQHLLYKISKQLTIYASYHRFLEYLYDSEKTNPYMLFDLIYHMGALLLIWDREHENVVTIRTPFSPKNKMWYNGHHNIPYIMVMQQETYYEPLVLVDQHKNVTQKVPFIHFDKLTQLIGVFPEMMKNEDMHIQNLYSLSKWIAKLFSKPSEYKLERLILNANDNAIGIFLVNNLYISFNKPLSAFSLKNVIELCKISKIHYLEDITGIKYNIECNIYDLKLLENKLLKINMILKKGQGILSDEHTLKSIYTVPRIIYKEPPKIQRIIKDNFVTKTDDTETWYNVKKAILTKLVKDYDTIVLPRLKLTREKLLKYIYNEFKDLNEPSHTAVIIEEIQLNNKDILKKDLDELLIEKAYFYKDTVVHDDKKHHQWVFSQKAVEKQLIENVKNTTLIHRPRNYPKEENEVVINSKMSEPPNIPDFLNATKLTRNNIPSKWRSKKFREYEIGTLKTYSRQSLIELFEWIALQKDIQFDINDLNLYLRTQVNKLLGDKNMYEIILEDPYLREEWVKYFRGRTVNEIIKNGFEKTTTSRLREIWQDISKNTPDRMFQDMDLYNISELLQINFLILQKGKDVRKGGGNLDELVGSSKFISNLEISQWPNIPIFILFKDTYKEKPRSYFVYSILIKNNEPSYFKFGYLVPDDIRSVIEAHIKRLRKD